MRKLLTIARREFAAMVATKAFLLSITFMPLLMGGGVLIASYLQNRPGDTSDRRIVVADGTGGELFDELKRAADDRNEELAAANAHQRDSDNGDGSEKVKATGAKYVLQRYAGDSLTDDNRLALSDEVRSGKLKAFVEIPPGVLAETSSTSPGNNASESDRAVRFYSSAANFSDERRWVESVIQSAVRMRRFAALNLDPALVARATANVPVIPQGLVKQLGGGRIAGRDGRDMTNIFLPFAFMMLMFMIIMLSAQPLLESAIEEKNGRIAEVLLGSVNSFQLMAGKLLGNVAGSLTAVTIYVAGAYAAAAYKGWTGYVPWELLPWFVVYQVLAVLLFSSIFMAVGASVTQLKEAQSMLLPVWLLMCIPMFVWLQLVREPNGPLATALSFFPPSAPLVMVLRLASEETVPLWQILASLAALLVATLAITYLAARIFRVGILWQGQSPKLTQIARWALRG